MNSLDWTLLRSFLAVVESGSLSAAAARIGTTHPTLSRHIRELETDLGVTLFTRSMRGVDPTEAALGLVDDARAMGAAAQSLALKAQGRSEQLTGTVRITASVVVANFLLPPIVVALREAEPNIQVEIVVSDLAQNLLCRDADIAIRMFEPTQNALIARKLGETAIGLFGASFAPSTTCGPTTSLAVKKNMGGETAEAWRSVLDDLVRRGLRRPELLIIDGGAGLESALAAIWGDVPTQRCTVHKHRNLLANAPERLHDEITADYNDMIYADTPQEVQKRRKDFLRKWRLRHPAVANSLEEAGDRLFTFTTLPPSQWKSARTTNAIERLHEEFKRRIKTQTVLPSAETAAMLFWALLASGQIVMRKIDGWKTLSKSSAQLVDLAA
jgi:DNA-binding transcriptional LysR family regulator